MTNLVLTAIGDDRPGLVDALSAVVADHGGNWDRAQMSRLGGKFAGIVLVTVPDDRVDAVRDGLAALSADGVLDVDVVMVDGDDRPPAPAAFLALSGIDRPGVLRDMARVLAERGISIEALDTATVEAPMAGGLVFEVTAALVLPAEADLDDLRDTIEAALPGFLVDLEPAEPE